MGLLGIEPSSFHKTLLTGLLYPPPPATPRPPPPAAVVPSSSLSVGVGIVVGLESGCSSVPCPSEACQKVGNGGEGGGGEARKGGGRRTRGSVSATDNLTTISPLLDNYRFVDMIAKYRLSVGNLPMPISQPSIHQPLNQMLINQLPTNSQLPT